MADADVGTEGGGAPLPPKRPTIIRPAPVSQPPDDKRSVPQRPAPARPAPPPPGSKPHLKPDAASAGAPPLRPAAVPPPASAPSKLPDPSSPLPKRPTSIGSAPSKSSGRSQGSVRKRPEITIVDARPMSQAGFRDMKAQQELSGSTQKTEVNKSHESQGKAPVLPSRPPPKTSPSQPPPPIPASRPGPPPPVPDTPRPVSQPAPPVPQSAPQSVNSCEDGSNPVSSDNPPKSSRPTILRPAHPKSAVESSENPDEDTTSPSPPLPKRSPIDGPPPKPARLAYTTALALAAEGKSEEPEKKTEERVKPKKPTRVSIIRPPLKRKTAVDEADGGAEVEKRNSEGDPEGQPASSSHPVPPALPSGPAAHVDTAGQAASAPPVPAARPKSIAGTDTETKQSPQQQPTRPPPVPASRPSVSLPSSHPGSSDAAAPVKPPPPSVRTGKSPREQLEEGADALSSSGPQGLPEPLIPSRPPPPPQRPATLAESGDPSRGHSALNPQDVPSEDSSHSASQPSRPPRPPSGTRPQPPPPPVNRPLPSVPLTETSHKPEFTGAHSHAYEEITSPHGSGEATSVNSPGSDASSPRGHLYESVEVTENTNSHQTTPHVQSSSSALSPHHDQKSAPLESSSPAEVEDVSRLYAKVNKPLKHTSQSGEDDQSSASAASPFGVHLKHVTADSESSEQRRPSDNSDETVNSSSPTAPSTHSSGGPSGAEGFRKPPVTAPKPKPSVLPKPQVAAKPRPAARSPAEPPGKQETSPNHQLSVGAHSPDNSEPAQPPRPVPATKRPTIIRSGPKCVEREDANTSKEAETVVQMRSKGPGASPRPQSLTEGSTDAAEVRTKPEPPVPAKRPVTIIGFPHRHKPQEDSTKTEQPRISPPVPRQRTSPPAEKPVHEESGSLEKKTETAGPPVSRPPPPRPDNKSAKAPDKAVEVPDKAAEVPEPEGRTKSDSDPSSSKPKSGSDPAPPRPPSPAPPRPTTRPPAKDAGGGGGEGAVSAHSTPRYVPPIKRKDHNAEQETVDEKSKPSEPTGPPPRPASMPPVRPPLTSDMAASGAKDAKREKPARPKPARQAAVKEHKQAPPPLPHRPGLSHPLYGYMMTQPHAIALYDYPAKQEDELPFEEGDIIVLLKRVDDQWLMGCVGDKEGLFPENFVSIIHPLHEELPTSAIDEIIDSVFEDALQEKPDNLTGPRCRARFDFEGEGAGDLAFEDGDVIQLLAHCGNDWLKGQLNGKTGIFPAAFVEIIEDLPKDKSHSAASGVESNETVALFDFEGEPGELSFQAGDKIEIQSKVNDQWLYGRSQGKEGSFPASFVDNVPENLPVHTPSSPVQKSLASHTEPPQLQQASSEHKSYCTALYDFEGEREGDLPFKEGDHIEILEHIGQDWLRGRLRGKEGAFPMAFVKLESDTQAEASADIDMPDHGTSLDSHSGLVRGVALYDFTGEAEGELSFKAGDEIVLGSMVSEGSEWQWGELNGKKGMFPSAFVEML